MICLRCGYCCNQYDVIIVDDPDKGPIEGNLKEKLSGQRCQHLRGDKPGEYSCAVHDRPWYQDTPCFAYTQIERGNTPCRMGEYLLEKLKNVEQSESPRPPADRTATASPQRKR